MTLHLTRGTGWSFESPPFEESPGGVAILPLDPSKYPQFVITDPDGGIIQQGVCKALTDRVYTSYFHVPMGATLSYPGHPWRISWLIVSASGRQIEASFDFEVVDTVDVTEEERSYTYIVRMDKGERLLFRTMQRPEELSVELIDMNGNIIFTADQRANEGIPAQSDEIQEVVEGSQYIYYIDLPNFTTAGEYHAIWDWRQTLVSPRETTMQVVRVVPQGIWRWFTPLRMMIDKLQKKQGRPHAYTDADIYEYLLRGVDVTNAKAPATSWTLTSFPHFCGADSLLLAGAALWALRAQYIMEGELSFCLAAGTQVSTPEGLKPIEKLVGNLLPGFHNKQIDLLTPDGVQTTYKVYVSKPKETVTIKTVSGFEITCTPNEPFYKVTGKSFRTEYAWTNAEDLQACDLVAVYPEGRLPPITGSYTWGLEEISSITSAEKQTTYDVCLPETDSPLSHGFIANGFVVHNSYGGQTLSLDLDHTGTYSEAASMWQQYLDDNARPAKLCVLRRGGNTVVGLRPYGIGSSGISRPMRNGGNFSGGAYTLLGLLDM